MFNNICKFLAESFRDDLVAWLSENPIQLTELKARELSNEPIRADSLILLQSEDLVLHTEFQTDAHKTMPLMNVILSSKSLSPLSPKTNASSDDLVRQNS